MKPTVMCWVASADLPVQVESEIGVQNDGK
jgi:hypothetical protein